MLVSKVVRFISIYERLRHKCSEEAYAMILQVNCEVNSCIPEILSGKFLWNDASVMIVCESLHHVCSEEV